MKKRFNDTGLCVPEKHYMVDISPKIDQILEIVERGDYFTINRPRQFGKTTIIAFLNKIFIKKSDYFSIKISFESFGDASFQSESTFCPEFVRMLARRLKLSYQDKYDYLWEKADKITNINKLSDFICDFVQTQQQKVVLLIDEVDKSSNNQLFLTFLGMLRDKYLLREEGESTFHSVILTSVHDIKTIKLKIRPDKERKLNSPWNIAIDFDIDLTFSAPEIQTMLRQYTTETGNEMNIPAIAEKIYYYTAGYPYLVSKMCKIIDEKFLPQRNNKSWTLHDVEKAFQTITAENYTTSLFDDLTKNLENYPKLYDLVFDVVYNGSRYSNTITNPVINQAILFGIFDRNSKFCRVTNRIFEQKIYSHILAGNLIDKKGKSQSFEGNFVQNNELQLLIILKKFQQFMRENYAQRDQEFLEREGRLLFLSFLKPIINGKGFEFKEPVVGDERRMDLVITFAEKRYVLELKIWRGEAYHQKGLQQLSDYLDMYDLKKGYLLIYDFRKEKQYKEQTIQFQDKEIEAVWV